jgi:BirA family biotin operon repressor/biotin-[acetyl-CoA-carboxylase] ligase
MTRLKNMIDRAGEKGESLPSGTVVMARELSGGSGRFDRTWHAPLGGLWMAVAWADTLLPEYAGLLPLAAGTACCEAVRSLGIDAALKWVNDIHVRGRKIGGILCETFLARTGDRYHLIGIGINCNVGKFPAPLRDSAVSMHELLKQEIDIDSFSLNLLASLTWNFGLVHLQEEFALADRQEVSASGCFPVADAWRRLSDTPGRRVCYGFDVIRSPLYTARALDIDSYGGLVMELDEGGVLTEYSGEVLYLD